MTFPRTPERVINTVSKARILFIARHAPIAPGYECAAYPGDGGYPAYYRRVWETLCALGYDVATANAPLALLGAAGEADLVFSLYNRMRFENPEIFIPSLCSFLGVPVLGAPANIRALAEDKWLAKQVARAAGLPVPEGRPYDNRESLAQPPDFPGPYFIKHRFGAASEGVTEASIQDDWEGAKRTAQIFLDQGRPVLVERFAKGLDLTLPVLGGSPPIPLGLVHPISDRSGGVITEDLKRDDPLGYEIADIGADRETSFLQDMAALWRAAGPMDYFRMDYRFDPETGERAFLEFNICCYIGRSSAFCLAAKPWGLEQADLLRHVVEHSLARQTPKKGGWMWRQ